MLAVCLDPIAKVMLGFLCPQINELLYVGLDHLVLILLSSGPMHAVIHV